MMNRQIFLDMDGVLVDLHKPFAEHIGVPYEMLSQHMDFSFLVKPVELLWKGLDIQWWADLPWMPDGKQILTVCENMVGKDNVYICSHPANSISAAGKLQWIEGNLPDYSSRYVLVKDKWTCASARTLLIDDHPDNILQFYQNGGAALLCPRRWNGNEQDDVAEHLLSMIEGMLQ
jgi:5'(3')-deoxyribonucleotidase